MSDKPKAERLAAFRKMDALAAQGDSPEYRQAFDDFATIARVDPPWEYMPALNMDGVIVHRLYDDDGAVVAEFGRGDLAEYVAQLVNAALTPNTEGEKPDA